MQLLSTNLPTTSSTQSPTVHPQILQISPSLIVGAVFGAVGGLVLISIGITIVIVVVCVVQKYKLKDKSDQHLCDYPNMNVPASRNITVGGNPAYGHHQAFELAQNTANEQYVSVENQDTKSNVPLQMPRSNITVEDNPA